ncbi:ABC transporter ATP-binding protein [Olleya namhaensis]|uniref:Lipopolysaccharide transport system ATP-binding protein n=1 Tax=Olleya namhaensis TaxID=1144750 RepID=A0A1I3NII0_9FLAO|nr:ABC transporter ATP-binding protein [Olleya namhaensis]SFJ09144.1 lipopolysaccharide transport system ATP-binding protein [Olleya namhaensis]
MVDSQDIILKAQNISKQYRLGLVGTGTISHDLNRWWNRIRGKEDPYLKVGESNDRSTKGSSEYVWALKDINFEVKRGEVLGIIGKNGAGKSTLLKILSKVTGPTTGEIKTRGRIASLLEVGTGFHGEMTGRENIFLNGAILGMTKKEITAKIDEIIDFSGCQRYIDTPVKRYSSGMTVRLAFAVAAFLEPEILVIDEVLAVGDAEFQKKAIGKMQDISRGEGRTVLFVSHNMAAVKSLCTRGIVLEHGKIKFSGNIDDCLSVYSGNNSDSRMSNYKGKGIIKKAWIPKKNISFLDTLEIKVAFETNIEVKKLILGIVIKDDSGRELLSVNNKHYNQPNLNSELVKKGEVLIAINRLRLIPGKYSIDLFFGDTLVDLEILLDAITFQVSDNNNSFFLSKINLKNNPVFHENIEWGLQE